MIDTACDVELCWHLRKNYPALCAQWLGRAVDLIAELPSTIATDELHSLVYCS